MFVIKGTPSEVILYGTTTKRPGYFVLVQDDGSYLLVKAKEQATNWRSRDRLAAEDFARKVQRDFGLDYVFRVVHENDF